MLGRRQMSVLSVVGAVTLTLGPVAGVARAAPDTPVAYPSGSSATRVEARAFDSCTAPSLDALKAWKGTSGYGVVNVYFGGRNRGCGQPNLSKAWVREVRAMGWRLLPTYFGDQPVCIFGTKPYRYTASTAAARGGAEAKDAVAQARSLGMLPGSALYADVEHYDRSDATCRTAVLRYVSAWVKGVHAAGYLAGVYAHQDSGVRDLADAYDSTTYARADAVWMSRWDGVTSLTGWPTAPDWMWSRWQRAKQYRGDHTETWGEVSLNVDSDIVKAPVATVGATYRASATVNVRSGPSSTYPVVGTRASGSSLTVVCQTTGQKVGATTAWDRLVGGGWVSDRYVTTPWSTGFTAGLPRCTYPGQVIRTVSLRSGPGTAYPTRGTIYRGALAWVACQRSGALVGTTRVWDKLKDGRWISDHHVSNRSTTSWSRPVPRCP